MAEEARTRAIVERELKAATEVADILKLADELKEIQASERKAALARITAERQDATKALVDPIRKLLAPMRDTIVRLGGVVRVVYEPENEELVDVSIGTKSAPRATGNGGRQAGSWFDKYGMTLGSIFEAHATPEEREQHDSADNNTKRWQIKTRVAKRAESDGALTPKAS